MFEQAADISGFAEGGNDQGQFFHGANRLGRRRRQRCSWNPLHVGSTYHCTQRLGIEDKYTGLIRLRRRKFLSDLLAVAFFTVLGFAVMGYHPGAEDDGVYLTAVKACLNPALYPRDSSFFRLQLQATQFDAWMADFVGWTGIPLAWSELLWQAISLFVILLACASIARQLFSDKRAHWGAVAMVSAMFTLPVAGTALTVADQYLHPRNLATALILIAVATILAGRRWLAVPLLLLAFLVHPIMAAFGISFCSILSIASLGGVHEWVESRRLRRTEASAAAAAAPLGWIFSPPTASWRRALNSKKYFHLYRWTWYEWLGAIAPIFLFWLLWRFAEKRGERRMARFALAVLIYGVFQQAVALIVASTPALVRLTPMQPMRFLHLIYLFLALIGGGLLGEYLLKSSVWRWALFLLATNAGMFAAQRQLFPGSEHLEMPGRPTANPWQQAFAWIRENTPTGAYFAVGAHYMSEPGEDYHSFRALAERSEMADANKDAAMVAQVPELGPVWEREVDAQAGWANFKLADFERLKAEFGVDWVLVAYPQPAGLDCRWHNEALAVCRIP